MHAAGPLAGQRKIHALLSPGLGEGRHPRHTEDAPPLAARVSHLEICLLRDLGGGEVRGGDRGDRREGLGTRARLLSQQGSSPGAPFSCGSSCLPGARALHLHSVLSQIILPVPRERSVPCWGLICPVLGRYYQQVRSGGGGSPRKTGALVSGTQAAASGS